MDSITGTVRVRPDYSIYIPNAFTPNDDGVNDVFKAMGTGIIDFEMTIFDRWGGIVFNSKDINVAWNARKDNTKEKVQTGVYVCRIDLTDAQRKKHQITSTVTVIYRK
jgi:gliding motility-associated-like protein